MAQAGRKHELFSVPTPLEPESGRYEIAKAPPEASPADPEAEPHVSTASALRLLEINQLSSEELGWIEARRSSPNLEPVRGATSAVFAKEGEDPTFEALRPFYREPTLERVQLQFEDRSLDPAENPLAHNSLKPAARRALGLTGALAVGVTILALSSVAYLAGVAGWGVHERAATQEAAAKNAEPPHLMIPDTVEQPAPTDEATDTAREAATDDVPWSVPAERQPAESADPAPAPTPASSSSAPVRRRRLNAWRARLAHARAASAAPSLVPVAVAAVPAQPTREQIRAGLESVRPALQACAGVLHGTSTARINIASTGRVASANIHGAFAGTPEGSCMARTLRGAVFPRFSDPNLQVTYPFRL